jgi:ATP/ADP translocase/HEAT repeat protein
MAGHTVLETARDALFLARIPASQLAFVYMAIAALALVLFVMGTRRQVVQSETIGLALGLVVAACVNLLFWWLLRLSGEWVLYAIYIWCGVFASLLVSRFWILAAGLFNIGQAKRLLPAVALGGVLGAILGAGLSGVLAASLDARQLLLASSALFLTTGLVTAVVMPRPSAPPTVGAVLPEEPLTADLLRTFRHLTRGPYLPRIAALALLATITVTLVDLLFKSQVAANIAPDRLGAVFGATYFALNLLSLLCQVFLVSWLVRTLDVGRLLALLPSLLLVAGLGVAAGLGLMASYLAKAIDGSLRHTLNRTTTELLWVPVASEIRQRTKAFVDVLGQRIGQAVASLFFLWFAAAAVEPRVLGLLISGLAALWCFIALTIRRPYLDLFRQRLKEAGLAVRIAHPELDQASLEGLFAQLSSPDVGNVLAALELLAAQGRTHLIPNLILYHPSPAVVGRALQLFREADRDDFLPLTSHLLESAEPSVRAAALRARFGLVAPGTHLPLLNDPSPEVRATALATFTNEETDRADEARQELDAILESGAIEEQLAFARLAREQPGSVPFEVLGLLSRNSDPQLRTEVVAALGACPDPNSAARLVELLADPAIRREVRRALAKHGERAVTALQEALLADDCDPSLRRHLPRALAELAPATVVPVLLDALRQPREAQAARSLVDALLRVVRTHPSVEIATSDCDTLVADSLSQCYELLGWLLGLEQGSQEEPDRRTAVYKMLHELVQHRYSSAVQQLLAALELRCGDENLAAIRRGLSSDDEKLRAGSLELLENALDAEVRTAVIALLDGRSGEHALTQYADRGAGAALAYEDLLAEWLESAHPRLAALAGYHAAELGLYELRSGLDPLTSSSDEMIAGIASEAESLFARSTGSV